MLDFLTEHWDQILFIVIGFGLIIAFEVMDFLHRRRRVELLRKHTGLSIETFRQESLASGYNVEVADAVYSDLTKLCGFAIALKDTISELRIGREDFEDEVEERCIRIGMNEAAKLRSSKYLPINTVEDYMRFLSAVLSKEMRI